MSEHWRGNQGEETAMSRWFRSRWQYGSVYVLDIDRIVCKPDFSLGHLIEEKHERSANRNWHLTSWMAERLGWHAALFVYGTDDGTPYGTVTRIDATWQLPDGSRSQMDDMSPATFDRWAARVLGAVQPEVAA